MFDLDPGLQSPDHAQSPAGGEHEVPTPRSPIAVARKLGRSSLTDAMAGFAPARKGGDDEHEGVDTEGEDQADQVEHAVKQGKSARHALGGHDHEGDQHEHEGHGAPAMAGVAAAHLPARKRPALSANQKFSMGMNFNPHGLEKHYTYKIWEQHPPIEMPVGAVPGLNLMLEPAVSVSVTGGVDFKKKAVTAGLGVDGSVGVGFSYGNSHVASLYGVMEAHAKGGFEYEKNRDHWSLDGKIALTTNFKVGVKLAEVIDHSFEFGKCELGTLTGVSWKNGHFEKDKLGWTWGDKPQEFFGAIKKAIDKAKGILNKVNKVKDKVTHKVSHGLHAAEKWVSSW